MAKRHKVNFSGVFSREKSSKKKITWEYRTLRLYVPFWVDGTKRKLKCFACKKIIDMHGRTYHFQLCEKCRLLIFPLAMPRKDRDGSWL